MSVRRILVTGAAGFIGRATVAHLQSLGIETIATDVREHSALPNLLTGNLLDQEFVDRLLEKSLPQAVIHLAGMLPSAVSRDSITGTRINIGASCSLLERAKKHGIARFVFGSSISVYGGGWGTTCVAEQMSAAPASIYGAAKRYVEMVGESLEATGFSFSALRIATTVGEGVSNSSSPWRSEIFESLRANAPVTISVPFAESVVLPLVRVEDIGRMLAQLATSDTPIRGVFNSPAESVSVADLARLIASLNPNVNVKAGTQTDTGIPAFISGNKLISHLKFESLPLRTRMEALRKSLISSPPP